MLLHLLAKLSTEGKCAVCGRQGVSDLESHVELMHDSFNLLLQSVLRLLAPEEAHDELNCLLCTIERARETRVEAERRAEG